MIRIRHPQGTASFPHETGKSTVADLGAFLATLAVAPQASGGSAVFEHIDVKTGYPPRSVDVSGLSSDSLLSEPPLSLQRGDQLIVASKVGAGMSAGAAQGSTASTPAAVRPPAAQGAFGFSSTMNSRTATSMPAAQQSSQSPSQMAGSASLSRPPAAVKDAEVHVALNGGAEHLTLKVAPDDNSCLFHAVGLVIEQAMGPRVCSELRQIVASEIQSNPIDFDDAVLGMARDKYVQRILDPKTWGGAIELSILAKHFSTELVSLDVSSGVSYRFGEGSGYPGRAYLVHSGIHYDALALLPTPDAPLEFGRTLFDNVPRTGEDDIDVAAKKLIASLKQRHYHTDTATFTLRCGTCGDQLVGEKAATQHATKTGHTDFREA